VDDIKGISYIIHGFERVLKKNPEIFLHIVGDGRDRKKLEGLVAELGIGKNVVFYGETKDPVKFYQNSDIFIIASKVEGLPNVLLEAMSCGLACIGTAVGGIPEILHPEGKGEAPAIKKGEIFKASNGILIPYGSEESIALAIETLINDYNLRKRYSVISRETILKEFSFEKITNNYLNLYRDLIKKM
jgi:glycosyltransferase involved in cell wall biosynthesis